ncbi:uncharacterized protein BDZ83DRAFT_656357 [Colletotrichum acutatum]|uniref:Uncharacterized protein n=1 Tax=Glomerella acutata TaxID=27357 RepID=A0AAD8U8W1_GLOAC|nr:uncharacterized protein BDZ83DRAFT_656357 [Colletotrichum acutatum]KAK1713315.1 hypothetical protein BDZ83DRAFT_656357 [Colletotrichum acutatum]
MSSQAILPYFPMGLLGPAQKNNGAQLNSGVWASPVSLLGQQKWEKTHEVVQDLEELLAFCRVHWHPIFHYVEDSMNARTATWPLWPGHRRGLLTQASLIGFYAHETVTTLPTIGFSGVDGETGMSLLQEEPPSTRQRTVVPSEMGSPWLSEVVRPLKHGQLGFVRSSADTLFPITPLIEL